MAAALCARRRDRRRQAFHPFTIPFPRYRSMREHVEVLMESTLPLWEPSAAFAAETPMRAFMEACATRFGQRFDTVDAFHAWSVAERGAFWSAVWDVCGVIGLKGERALVDEGHMTEAPLLPRRHAQFRRKPSAQDRSGRCPGVPGRGQGARPHELRCAACAGLAAAAGHACQRHRGRRPGGGDDAEPAGNHRPDARRNLDRRHLVVLLAGFRRTGHRRSLRPDRAEAVRRLRRLLVQWQAAGCGRQGGGRGRASGCAGHDRPYCGDAEGLAARIPGARTLAQAIAPFAARAIAFTPLPFSHPVFILFSSGTTGVPKCIVHGAGGTLLQLMKEHRFHCGAREGDKVFYFTTCGWMMWNWLAAGLASGETLCLYDGSPFHPSGAILFDYAQEEGFSIFGTSAKYIDAVRKAGLRPAETHDLAPLRLITSTGSPLSPEGFSFVYEVSSRMCSLPPFPAAPTSSPASCSAIR